MSITCKDDKSHEMARSCLTCEIHTSNDLVEGRTCLDWSSLRLWLGLDLPDGYTCHAPLRVPLLMVPKMLAL